MKSIKMGQITWFSRKRGQITWICKAVGAEYLGFSFLLSSGPVQFCMLVVGDRGCRKVSASWVGGGKNRDGMRVVDSHAKDAGGTFATDQEAC